MCDIVQCNNCVRKGRSSHEYLLVTMILMEQIYPKEGSSYYGKRYDQNLSTLEAFLEDAFGDQYGKE